MARSRRRAWLRDELILALDLYVREGAGASVQSVDELSALLRTVPIEPLLASDPTFRSPGSIRRKLANFLDLDPGALGGLSHGGIGDRDVWDEFANDPDRLGKASAAIRATLAGLEAQPELVDEPTVSEAPEGRLLTRVHLARERSAKLVEAKKKHVLAEAGKLECQTCGFDFGHTYGERGEGFIECHHLRPLVSLRPGDVTHLSDLALLCSNCHRISPPRDTVAELGAADGAHPRAPSITASLTDSSRLSRSS